MLGSIILARVTELFVVRFKLLSNGDRPLDCFFVNVCIMTGSLCIFVYISMMMSSPGSLIIKPMLWLNVFLDSRLQCESLEGSSVSGSKVKTK